MDFTPTPLALSADGRRLYSGNQGGSSVSAIDTASNTVLATVPLPELPNALAVTPDGSRVYVALSNTVAAISTLTYTVVATIPVGFLRDGLAFPPTAPGST